MIRLLWTSQTLKDLLDIRDYIAKDSPHHADLVVRRLFSAAERIDVLPVFRAECIREGPVSPKGHGSAR